MKRFFGLVLFIGLVSSCAFAQEPPPMPPGGFGGGGQRMQIQLPTFADIDKNKDKKISKEEWASSQLPPQMFDRLDSNHDGFIDEEEFNAMRRGFGGGGNVMMMGGGGDVRHKYNLTISVNANDILNHVNFANYNGVLTSSFFGIANSTVRSGFGGGFGGGGGSRRIDMSVRFNF